MGDERTTIVRMMRKPEGNLKYCIMVSYGHPVTQTEMGRTGRFPVYG